MPTPIAGTSPTLYQLANTDCVGDSLPYINNNTVALNTIINSNINTLTTLINSVSALLGSAPSVAKAWVNFDGTGSGSITPNSKYNVSSVTRNANGDYTITFATPFANANYCALVGMSASVTAGVADGIPSIKTQSAGSVRVNCPIATTGSNPGTSQPSIVNVVVYSY
jgi:hypothetical protein